MMLLALLAASPAMAGDFIDTWVTLALEDTNVLAGPEEESPAANFVQRGNTTFFENYESRYTDDITQSHLALYRKDDAFWPGWYTEAAFVVQFSPYLEPDQTSDGVDIVDDGSYIRLVKQLGDDEDSTFSVTGYAIDAARFKLGYSYDLTWGGKEIFIDDPSAAPGIRFQLQKKGNYVFAGAKTSIQDQLMQDGSADGTTAARNEAYWGLLGGAGLEFNERFKLEGQAGLFRQGQLYNMDSTSELWGDNVNALGFATQVAWRSTEEIDFIQSSELKVYRNAPEFVKDSYISHLDIDGTGILVQGEANFLMHNLANPEKTSTVLETAAAGDLQVVFVKNTTQLGFDLVYKDLSYILFNVPGLSSGVAIGDVPHTPQLYGRATLSRYSPSSRLTPALGVGLMQPATYTDEDGVVVVPNESERDRVPKDQDVTEILGSVVGLQVDVSKSVVLVGEALYTMNNNESEYECKEGTVGGNCEGVRVAAAWNRRNQLGFNLMMRARF